MTKSEPSIRINVDPTNPGQFFACCGLLELADRLWPGAEGWFHEAKFFVTCDGSLQELLAILVMDSPEALTTLENGLSVKPLIAPLRFSFDGSATHALTLDAWMTIRLEKGKAVAASNPPWNFWAGQQKSFGIWSDLRAALAMQIRELKADRFSELFTEREMLKGRFGFDAGPAWLPLDVGFSPNDQSMNVASSPAVELLAAVGIQRFRPVVTHRTTITYTTWGRPLSPSVAAAATAGMVFIPPSTRYQCRTVDRGQGYAALSHSFLLQGDTHE